MSIRKKSLTRMSFIVSLTFLLACTYLVLAAFINGKTSVPHVVEVFPSQDTLPENLLRLYVQFSEPMKAINNLENIRIMDNNGEEVHGAIFDNVYELWDRDQMLLTLILDPARVKTGLEANQKMGRALKSGFWYTLILEQAESINGKRTEHSFSKKFFVTGEDMMSPEISQWIIEEPKPNTRGALTIKFPQSLDRNSLLHRIAIIDKDHHLIKGSIDIRNNETLFSFMPEHNWNSGKYKLVIHNRLEDPSGNNLNGLFDHKIGDLKNINEGETTKIDLVI